MKLHNTTLAPAQIIPAATCCNRGGKNGFAVLFVLELLALMVVFVSANTLMLTQLHREIRLIEQRQLKKFGSASVQPFNNTNATAIPVSATTKVNTNGQDQTH